MASAVSGVKGESCLPLATMLRGNVLLFVVISLVGIIMLVKISTGNFKHTLNSLGNDWQSRLGLHSSSFFDTAIKTLWSPIKVPIEQPTFTDQEGTTHTIPPDNRIWTKNLGKKVCILDTDTRPMDGSGQMLNKAPLQWNRLDHYSAGMLSHYLYAKIHGYNYQMLRAPKWEDRADSWVKVLMTREALKTHDVVVFLDSDAPLVNPELPIEWLLNYWQIRANTTIALASDPDLPRDLDDRGVPAQNTGFMIVQNLPQTWALFDAWADCPSEKRYAGCSKWIETRQREQAAFSNYVRYDPEFAPTIQVLPCTEANGYPEMFPDTKCNGIFVRHYWLNKDLVKEIFAGHVMRTMAPALHKHFVESWEDKVVDLRIRVAVGSKWVDE